MKTDHNKADSGEQFASVAHEVKIATLLLPNESTKEFIHEFAFDHLEILVPVYGER